MKKLILLFLLIFSINSYSQKKSKEERQMVLDIRKTEYNYVARDSLKYPIRYCLLMAQSKLSTNKVEITIDYGQDSSLFEDTRIRDKNGKLVKFNSVMDALNYMASLGWEFVDAYAISIENTNVYHYLLKASLNVDEGYIPKTIRDIIKEK